jgi:hypothetical protein
MEIASRMRGSLREPAVLGFQRPRAVRAVHAEAGLTALDGFVGSAFNYRLVVTDQSLAISCPPIGAE